jgi:hypothetical protein
MAFYSGLNDYAGLNDYCYTSSWDIPVSTKTTTTTTSTFSSTPIEYDVPVVRDIAYQAPISTYSSFSAVPYETQQPLLLRDESAFAATPIIAQPLLADAIPRSRQRLELMDHEVALANQHALDMRMCGTKKQYKQALRDQHKVNASRNRMVKRL